MSLNLVKPDWAYEELRLSQCGVIKRYWITLYDEVLYMSEWFDIVDATTICRSIEHVTEAHLSVQLRKFSLVEHLLYESVTTMTMHMAIRTHTHHTATLLATVLHRVEAVVD